MALSERLALVAALSVVGAACNLVAGLGDFQDVPCEPCEAGQADGFATPLPEDASEEDAATGTSAEADVDASFDAEDAADEVDATLDAKADVADADAGEAAPPPEGGAAVDYRWPLWPMPNVADGALPNAGSYAPRAGIDGGVVDGVTGLLWGPVRPALSVAAAKAACLPPARVPSRIELVSILDTSRPPPLVNPAFTTVEPSVFWTSSVTPANASWTVDFQTGLVGPSTATAVICVQSPGGP